MLSAPPEVIVTCHSPLSASIDLASELVLSVWSMSSPSPSRTASRPVPVATVSLPAPALIESFAGPPSMLSAASDPLIVSLAVAAQDRRGQYLPRRSLARHRDRSYRPSVDEDRHWRVYRNDIIPAVARDLDPINVRQPRTSAPLHSAPRESCRRPA